MRIRQPYLMGPWRGLDFIKCRHVIDGSKNNRPNCYAAYYYFLSSSIGQNIQTCFSHILCIAPRRLVHTDEKIHHREVKYK
jgi:hypothetical protein